MDRGTWQAAGHRVAQSWTQLRQLNMDAILIFTLMPISLPFGSMPMLPSMSANTWFSL